MLLMLICRLTISKYESNDNLWQFFLSLVMESVDEILENDVQECNGTGSLMESQENVDLCEKEVTFKDLVII